MSGRRFSVSFTRYMLLAAQKLSLCLVIVAETYDVREAMMFFEQNYSHIYFLFHEGFTNVEASLAQRG